MAEIVANDRRFRQNKNIVAYTCPEAQHALESGGKQRYMNEKIEAELVEFKEEIEKNFSRSEINKTYVFKRLPPEEAAANSKMVAKTNRITKNLTAAKEKPRASTQLSLSSDDYEDSKTGGSAVKRTGPKAAEAAIAAQKRAAGEVAVKIGGAALTPEPADFQTVPSNYTGSGGKAHQASKTEADELVVIDDQEKEKVEEDKPAKSAFDQFKEAELNRSPAAGGAKW